MNLTRRFASSFAPMVVLSLMTACGGKAVGAGGSISEDSGSTKTGTDADLIVLPDGARCVDIEPASLDDSCNADTDCTLVATGELCSGSCGCGTTPISNAGTAAYESAISSITLEDCPCVAAGVPRCVSHKCSACGGPNMPACDNTVDAGPPMADAAVCIDVQAASFSQTCVADTDCFAVTTGELCSGTCLCGANAAINNSALSAYDAAISSIMFAECECPSGGPAKCVAGSCIYCGFGSSPQPGCGDGG